MHCVEICMLSHLSMFFVSLMTDLYHTLEHFLIIYLFLYVCVYVYVT